MADVDLNLVLVFARVIELGSFTAASRALAMPKSSVSRAVTRLEEMLGARLVQRTTRKLGLTQAGARYLAEVRGPLTRLAEASEEISESSRQPRGLVRISLPPEAGAGSFAPVLVAFVQRHPGIRLDLVVTSRRVNLIEEGIDLALRGGNLDDSTLVARRIIPTELALYAAPAYLARKGRPRKLADLAGHDCIVFRSPNGGPTWRLHGPRGVEQVTVEGPITTDDMGSVRRLAIAGLGVALVPTVAVEPDVARGALVRVLPGHALRGPAMFVVSPPLRHVPARVALLRDFLIRELTARGGLPPLD
jgi:DNA-binding transcriptional LysR family regulator